METKADDAKQSTLNTFRAIAEMVNALRKARDADDDSVEDAEERIRQYPLTVEVRNDWHSIGGDSAPAEFRILLSTGGPSIQIVGKLTEDGEPETACLQYQDWFQPWAEWKPRSPDTVQAFLLDFARCFYFVEG